MTFKVFNNHDIDWLYSIHDVFTDCSVYSGKAGLVVFSTFLISQQSLSLTSLTFLSFYYESYKSLVKMVMPYVLSTKGMVLWWSMSHVNLCTNSAPTDSEFAGHVWRREFLFMSPVYDSVHCYRNQLVFMI